MSKLTTKLYGLKNCDSCRKALKEIKAAGIDAELVDVRETRLSKTVLSRWCQIFGREKLVNQRSTTWRGLSEEEKSFDSDKAAVALLQQHPSLMKRPIISQGKTHLLGYYDNVTLKSLKTQ